MKKYLVAGAAGLALAIPTSALADEMEDMGGLAISGSMTHDIGFGSWDGGVANGESADDLHFEVDAEIHFTATGHTDGGLTVTAVVEMEGQAGGGVDESHLTVAGGFGALTIGQQDNAANIHGNKGIGGSYGGGGYYDCGETWTPAACGGPPPNDDYMGIRYSTPGIGGMQAGVSYQIDTAGSHNGTSTAGSQNDTNVVAVGANFAGDFAGTSLTLGANHVTVDGGDMGQKQKSWGLGAAFGIGGTTLSLRYDTKADTHMSPDEAAQAYVTGGSPMNDSDTTSYGVGIDHTIGNLSFGIGYGHNSVENAVATHDGYGADSVTAGVVNYDQSDTTSTIISAGATYDLGGGVTVSAGIHSGDIENVDMGLICVDTDGNQHATDVPTIGAATDNICANSNLAQATSDMDDVGVGLRIAFSF